MSWSRLRVAAVVMAVLLLGSLLAVATPYYQTDDDAAMHLRSAGVVLAEEPSEFLLFTHPPRASETKRSMAALLDGTRMTRI